MTEEFKKEIEKLRREKQRINAEVQKLETVYMNTAISTGAVVKQLDELGKTANGFNKTSQRLNIGSFLSFDDGMGGVRAARSFFKKLKHATKTFCKIRKSINSRSVCRDCSE